jgi:hypothetical protein
MFHSCELKWRAYSGYLTVNITSLSTGYGSMHKIHRALFHGRFTDSANRIWKSRVWLFCFMVVVVQVVLRIACGQRELEFLSIFLRCTILIEASSTSLAKPL